MTIICGFYSMLCICIFTVYYAVSTLPYDKNATLFGLNTNLATYVLMLGGVYLFFFFLLLVYKGKGKTYAGDKCVSFLSVRRPYLACLPTIILFSVAIFFFYKIYCNENYIYPYWSSRYYIRGQVSKPIYAAITCVFYATFVMFSRGGKCSGAFVRIIFGIMVALLCSLLVYAPNPFFDNGGGLYHIHAYTNSIINTARLKPFDQYNQSIYGHYALLYFPFIKILGNDYTAVACSISLAAFITYYCAFAICEKTIKNDWCYVLTVTAICAVTAMFYSGGQYYQVNPHRLLFPIVTLFVIMAFQEKKPHPKIRWGIELLLGSMALIWNVETGLFAVITFCFYNFYNIISYDKKWIIAVSRCVALLFSCFVLSYTVVNLYNISVGAETWMTWKRFIYPIGSDTYSINSLGLKFPTPYSMFVFQMMIFSVALMNATIHIKDNKPALYENSRILLACTAISGLGSLSYFVNRAAYSNIAISCIQMFIIAGVYGSEAISELSFFRSVQHDKRKYYRTAGKLIMLFCVFIFAMETTLSFGSAISNRISTTWKTEELQQFVNDLDEMLPDETVGMGKGVPELFFQMGRDSKCVLTDWSDMNDENLEEATRILNDHDGYLFINTNQSVKENQYITIEEIPFGDDVYALCKKTNPVE